MRSADDGARLERVQRPTLVRVLALVALLFPPLFVAWFVSSERTVYFWDYANYWLKVVDLTAAFRADAAAAIASALRSVTTDKYNLLAALPLLPVTLATGTSRTSYAVTVVLVFGVPTLLLVAALVRRLAGVARDDATPTVVALLVAALLPQLWFPVLLGLLDVIGCIPILLVFLLITPDPLALRPKRAFVVGVLLGLLPLLRRWYAFFGVTFVATFALLAIVALLLERRRAAALAVGTTAAALAAQDADADADAGDVRRLAYVLFALIAGALVAALPLTGPVLREVFLRDHVFLHAPYRTTPGVEGALWRTWMYFGSLTLAAAAAGFVLALRERATRRLGLLIGVQTAVLVLVFNAVQTLGANHFYSVVPALLVFASLAYVRFVERASSTRARRRRLGVVAVILVANFAVVLAPPLASSELRMAAPVKAMFGRVRLAPERRHDVDELVRLAQRIAALLDERGGDSAYVLASSLVLNPDVLRNAHLSLPGRSDVPDLRSAIAPGVHVDRRDGFPFALLTADVVVTTDTPQLHLAAEEQQVVLLPAAEIRAGTTIGRAFRELPERFTLADGVVARLHVRTRPVDAEDARQLGERLTAAHGGAVAGLRPPESYDAVR